MFECFTSGFTSELQHISLTTFTLLRKANCKCNTSCYSNNFKCFIASLAFLLAGTTAIDLLHSTALAHIIIIKLKQHSKWETGTDATTIWPNIARESDKAAIAAMATNI